MKRIGTVVIGLGGIALISLFALNCKKKAGGPKAGAPRAVSPNGIAYPTGFKDWKVIGLSHREDNKTLRYILGNDIAVEAARSGKTNPWPKGSILAKMVWKEKSHPKWAKAIEPAKFVHAEFMIKDAKKYASTGGWGYARWKGLGQKPYAKRFNKEKKFSGKECMTCHLPVKGRDYVFTHAVNLP